MHAILVLGFCIHMHINVSLGALSYTCSLLVHLTSEDSAHSVTDIRVKTDTSCSHVNVLRTLLIVGNFKIN